MFRLSSEWDLLIGANALNSAEEQIARSRLQCCDRAIRFKKLSLFSHNLIELLK
ncbi:MULTISPECIES: hypothetical protein [Leptolyngbya]|uniref:hypothetical protein n=1 Tax=Leptolyngbya TaxID=47251 RepID=UPI0016846050|nr:hypothetical protein [Leptolyngbya sp. FACHB-1624]MBD1854750.1 hypothetical protein [Leptolyngbya sp. FACHB-1624]